MVENNDTRKKILAQKLISVGEQMQAGVSFSDFSLSNDLLDAIRLLQMQVYQCEDAVGDVVSPLAFLAAALNQFPTCVQLAQIEIESMRVDGSSAEDITSFIDRVIRNLPNLEELAQCIEGLRSIKEAT